MADIYLKQRILTATSLKCCSWLEKKTQQIKIHNKGKGKKLLHTSYSGSVLIQALSVWQMTLCSLWHPSITSGLLWQHSVWCHQGPALNPQLTGCKLADRHISILILVGEGITVRILVHFLRRNGPWQCSTLQCLWLAFSPFQALQSLVSRMN